MNELLAVSIIMIVSALLGAMIVFIWMKSRIELIRVSYNDKSENQAKSIAQYKKRVSEVFKIIDLYANSTKESDVLEIFLQTLLDLSGASGATYVPLDERELPLNAIIRGNLPNPTLDAWVEYLASPSVREKCGLCEQYNQQISECHLLNYQFSENKNIWEVGNIYCIPINIRNSKVGILNLYLGEENKIDHDLDMIFRSLAKETAMIIQAIRKQNKNIYFSIDFHASKLSNEIESILASYVDLLKSALMAEFVILKFSDNVMHFSGKQLNSGILPVNLKSIINDVIVGVDNSKQVVISSDIFKAPSISPGINSLIGLPIMNSEGCDFGVVLAGVRDLPPFSEHYISFLKEHIDHVSFLLKKIEVMSLLEYTTTIQERERIAREIHDGLAQTLGFLKLQTAQMIGYMAEGDHNLATRKLEDCYQLLNEAYDDAREAIDNLKTDVAYQDIDQWMFDFGQEFRNFAGFDVHVDCEDLPNVVPPEKNSQIIRIVQEALSNIRKHSKGKNVWLTCQLNDNVLFLEVRDDGVGFMPDDIRSPSRHGIKGMMERAELIGADFQILSNNNIGTSIQIQLPVSKIMKERD